MAQLKSTSVTGKLSVTGNTSASSFIKLGGTNNQILMADGGVKVISDLVSISNSGTGITVSNSNGVYTISHTDPNSSFAAGNYGPTEGATTEVNTTTTIVVPQITVDSLGHITGVTDRTLTITDTNTHASRSIISGTKKDGTTNITGSASTGDLTMGDSGASAGVYGDASNQTPAYGATFKVPYIRINSKGIVTEISEHTVKIPASDNTDTKVNMVKDIDSQTVYLLGATRTPTNSPYAVSTSANLGIMADLTRETLHIKGGYGFGTDSTPMAYPLIQYNSNEEAIQFVFA